MLEIVLAQQAAGFAPIHVRQADIQKNKVGLPVLHLGESLGGGVGDMRLELLDDASCSASDRASS